LNPASKFAGLYELMSCRPCLSFCLFICEEKEKEKERERQDGAPPARFEFRGGGDGTESGRIARAWSVQRRNGDDVARPGNGICAARDGRLSRCVRARTRARDRESLRPPAVL
jgi:hypothetical protein